MTLVPIKLKTGKVIGGGVYLVGEIVHVTQKTADKWIDAGEAEVSSEKPAAPRKKRTQGPGEDLESTNAET